MRLGVFKKGIKLVASGALVIVVGASIGVGAYYIKSCHKDQQLSDYYKNEVSDPEQVKLLFSATGADNRWVSNLNLRLGNNGKDPVYVSFDENFYKSENKGVFDTTKEVLDKFFNIMNSINEKYTYTILSDSELTQKKYGDKAVIKFYYDEIKGSEDVNTHATVQHQQKWKLFTINNFANNPTLREEFMNKPVLKRTLWHEFAHVCGENDVYDLHTCHKETVVDTKFIYENEHNINMFLPNDYACLLSMYTPNMSDLECVNFMETIPAKIDAYKTMYYNELSKSLKENVGENKDYCVYPADFENATFGICSFSKYPVAYININISNDKYVASLYDTKNTLVTSYSGKVYRTDNHIFLDDVYWEKGLTIKAYSDKYYEVPHYQSMGLFKYGDHYVLQDIVGRLFVQSEEKISEMKTTSQNNMYDYYNLDDYSYNLYNEQ